MAKMTNSTNLTIPSLLYNSFGKYKDNPFLGFTDETAFTYSEIEQKVSSMICFLEKLGVKKGDKVAILSNNMPNWGVVYFATTVMGGVVIPILPDFSKEEIQNILEHSETKILFCAELLIPKIIDVDNQYLIAKIKINDLSPIEDKLGVFFDSNAMHSNKYIVEEDDLALIIYTSGTMGKPKGVMLSHKNICFNAEKSGVLQPIFPGDKFLSFLPLSHAYEHTLGLLLPMMYGASVYYLRKLPTPAVLIPAMQQIKPSIMLSVPLIMEKIYKSKILASINSNKTTKLLYKISIFRKVLNVAAGRKLKETFGGNLRFFGIGGAKLDREVEKFLIEAKFPYAIGYGLTETAPLIAGANPDMVKLGSTGPKIEGIDIKLHDINPKTGEGEIWVKGPMVMQGYYKEPELTNQAITEDGWFKTGDLATIDKNKNFYIKGRSKNVIIGSSGENIYPEEIEAILNNFELVLDSLVIEKKGRLVALVHLNIEEMEKNYQNFKIEIDEKLEEIRKEIILYINSKVNKFSTIKAVFIQRDPFEKTPTLKIKRYKYIE
jgi:long-chain acyl-CoA synthetase